MSKIVTLRLEEKDSARIKALSAKSGKTQSELIRKAVLNYVSKEEALNEVKSLVAKKFAEGKLSFDELVRVIGYENAREVAYYVEVAERSLKEGI